MHFWTIEELVKQKQEWTKYNNPDEDNVWSHKETKNPNLQIMEAGIWTQRDFEIFCFQNVAI